MTFSFNMADFCCKKERDQSITNGSVTNQIQFLIAVFTKLENDRSEHSERLHKTLIKESLICIILIVNN